MSVRFAPSPTGAFHVGNFRTAWISHWWARRLGLPWVVRFEDIDAPRVVPGARERQLAEMQALGLKADRVELQSEFHARHFEVFLRAARDGKVYPCFCSRKDVREALEGAASAPHRPVPIYSGRCRAVGADARAARSEECGLPSLAWRFKADDPSGEGDFIVARTSTELGSGGAPGPESFVPAYNWACAIDDLDGAHKLLVRAWDLANVVEQQRAIQRYAAAGAWQPQAVFHCALVVQESGERLEKRTQGVTLPELLGRGIAHAGLVTRFERSFDASVAGAFAPGAVFGEARETLKLSELGL